MTSLTQAEQVITADVLDAHPELACVQTQFESYGGRARFSGPIRTLKCLEDTQLLMELVRTPGNGSVLVVDGEGSRRTALIGENHATTAAEQGWAGLVINGMARDTAGLASVNLGVRALGSVPRRSLRTGRGYVDIPVTFAGVDFEPGGWLWSDEDGIVVAPSGWSADQ